MVPDPLCGPSRPDDSSGSPSPSYPDHRPPTGLSRRRFRCHVRLPAARCRSFQPGFPAWCRLPRDLPPASLSCHPFLCLGGRLLLPARQTGLVLRRQFAAFFLRGSHAKSVPGQTGKEPEALPGRLRFPRQVPTYYSRNNRHRRQKSEVTKSEQSASSKRSTTMPKHVPYRCPFRYVVCADRLIWRFLARRSSPSPFSSSPFSCGSLFTGSVSASCSKSLRCSRVNFPGVFTTTCTTKSPRPRPCTSGTPLPFTRSSVVTSALNSFRNGKRVGALERRRSPRSRRPAHTACAIFTGTMQCRSLSWRSKIRVLFDGEENVQIAVRPAVRTRLPLRRHPQPVAVRDARRNGHLQPLVDVPIALAPAVAADVLDNLPRAAAVRARAAHRKKALRVNLLPATHGQPRARSRTAARLRAFTRAAPRTLPAWAPGSRRLFRMRLPQRSASDRSADRRPWWLDSARRRAVRKYLRNRKPAPADRPDPRPRVESPAARRARKTRMPVGVVSRPLLRIGKDAVSFGGFLKLLLCGVIARIAVRMILHRELAVRRSLAPDRPHRGCTASTS